MTSIHAGTDASRLHAFDVIICSHVLYCETVRQYDSNEGRVSYACPRPEAMVITCNNVKT